MWSALSEFAARLWDRYLHWVAPLYPLIQWGVAIGALLWVLGWGVKKVAAMMTECPNCKRVIPKTWNPCRMCGHVFEGRDGS